MFGLGLRIAMRVAAIVEGQDLELTLGGTAFIVVVGVVFGALFGPVAVMPGRLWKRHPVLGSALVGAPVGLAFVVLVGGSEILDVGNPVVNLLTFGSAGAAFGAVAAWRVVRRPGRGAARGAIVIGSVGASALALALTTPALAWVLDRIDGGTQVHPKLPGLRDPRIESLGDVLFGALGSLLGGAFAGLALAGVLILGRRIVVASRRPVLTIGGALAALGALTLLIPDGPRDAGNTAVIALGMAAMAVAAGWLVVRISEWFDPDVWGAGTS